jgi:hypothetical protein
LTIAAAVLADAPLLYWKLDDPTGPAASDSSGNGNPGVYGGTINLGTTGPEVGTHSALLFDGALIFSLGSTPRLVRPMSMEVWVALQLIEPAQSNAVYNGNGNVNGNGVLLALATTLSMPIQVQIGGHAIGALVGSVGQSAWHSIGLSVDVAQNTNMYIDGVNVYLNVNTGPWTAPVAGDKFQVGSNKPGQLAYFAHASLYGTVLSAARFAAHFAGNTTPQAPSPVSAVTSSVLAATASDLLRYIAKTFQNAP